MGAAALLESLPKAEWLLADRGYDADWYRETLKDKKIRVFIPRRRNRKKKIRHDRRRDKRRNRIEIIFGRLKDWRRAALDTTDARKPSSQPSSSPQRSCSGYDPERVLTLLYLGSARLAPSLTPARVSDGVVRDV
jgi:transposase